MATVSIERIQKPAGMLPALEEFERFTDVIAHRAYQLFEERGGNDGSDFDDWLEAERQILGAPAAEVVEGEDLFVLRIPLAGFTPVEIAVIACPTEIVLKAGTTRGEGITRDGQDQPTMMRRFAFATAVDVDSVAATLNKGVLTINAPKTSRG